MFWRRLESLSFNRTSLEQKCHSDLLQAGKAAGGIKASELLWRLSLLKKQTELRARKKAGGQL